jgi:hypothetical protein
MARSHAGSRRRADKIKMRVVSLANDHLPRCTILGCGQPTQRAAKSGLSATLCRKHVLHRQRHGSPWCPSPTASTLRPYVKAALSFIALHRNDPYVRAALVGLSGLMETAGPVVIATRLRGLPPAQRAKVALARLRESKVKPERLLAIALAVHGLINEAPQVVHRVKDWRIVAIAKTSHRLASGYHRVWEMADASGRIYRTELHAYPRSAGRVLHLLGAMIERECELVIDHYLSSVLALKVASYGPHPAIADPIKFTAGLNRRATR